MVSELPYWRGASPWVRTHLVIFKNVDAIEAILRGERRVEIRFSQRCLPPYGEVVRGDSLFLKLSGRAIIGDVRVDNVLYYDRLDPEMIGRIRREYEKELGVEAAFWEAVRGAHFVSLLFLREPRRYLVPVPFPGKHDRRAWVVLAQWPRELRQALTR